MFYKRRKALFGLAIVSMSIVALFGCTTKTIPPTAQVKPAVPTPDYWPTSGWKTSTPEAQGMDSQKLAEAVGYIIANRVNLHSFMIVRNGYVVLDAYFHPFEKGSFHDIASCTKSITSTLTGIAIDRGYLKGVSQKLGEIFPFEGDMLQGEAKQSITLSDLLTMSSGLDCTKDGSDIRTNLAMLASPDWARFSLDLPMAGKPGRRFDYCSSNSMILSAAINASSRMRADEFAKKFLFGPLGITNFIWITDPAGLNNQGGGDMFLTPHDMAKIGLLFLQEGRWEGAQVVSKQWVSEATTPRMKVRGLGLIDGYGYNWWIGSEGFYMAMGRGGQWIVVIPSMNIVMVFTGNSGSDGTSREKIIKELVLPSIKAASRIPENPEGVRRLGDAVRTADAGSDVRLATKPSTSLVAAEISGRMFILDRNLIGFDWMKFVFTPGSDTATFTLHQERTGQTEIAVGLNGIGKKSSGRFGLPVYASGSWVKPNEFEISVDEVANINRWKIKAHWDGSGLKVDVANEDGLPPLSMYGSPSD